MKTELLDLVGNVEHSIQFEKLVKQLKQSCETEFTVNQAIAFLRKLDNNPQYAGIFPYKAVKAEDNRYGPSMCFIDPVEGKSTPTMRLKKRQQMCVFKEAKDSIQLECFVEPQHFVERFNKE